MTRISQLDEAVGHALRAPSVHNTQPWRWRIDTADGVVELYADRGRHLAATDPEGRDLLISSDTPRRDLAAVPVRDHAPTGSRRP